MAENNNMPPEEDLNVLGEFFASQYYGLLCGEPEQMNRFYADHSTLIHVVDGDHTTSTRITSNLDRIREHFEQFKVDTVEIKSVNALNCSFSLGVLLVVMGSLKLKERAKFRDFVQTLYLAPHWKKNAEKRGYFIFNDILHIITHHSYVRDHSKLVQPLKSQDIDPRFISKPDTDNLDEAEEENTDDLMSTMENLTEFPPLPRKQQPLPQRDFGPSVWKTPLAQVESSSNSASVATIHENTDAPKIEEPVVVQEEPSQKSDDSALLTSSTSGGRGHNNSSERGSGDRNKGQEIKEPVVSRGHNNSSERGSGDRNKGQEIKEPVVSRGHNNSSELGSGDRNKGQEIKEPVVSRGHNNSSELGSGDRNKGQEIKEPVVSRGHNNSSELGSGDRNKGQEIKEPVVSRGHNNSSELGSGDRNKGQEIKEPVVSRGHNNSSELGSGDRNKGQEIKEPVVSRGHNNSSELGSGDRNFVFEVLTEDREHNPSQKRASYCLFHVPADESTALQIGWSIGIPGTALLTSLDLGRISRQ